MIVVADTTPLRYLVLLGCEHLLPPLYGRVLIPPSVVDELNHESTPEVVRTWLSRRPEWLEVRQPTHGLPPEVDLDPGERDVLLWQRRSTPICCSSMSGMPASKRSEGGWV